jgi:hypothetical protein
MLIGSPPSRPGIVIVPVIVHGVTVLLTVPE